VADPAYLDLALGHWRSLVGWGQAAPVLHITPYSLAPALLVMLEIIARLE
jgi:hypothetical protein